MDPGGPAVHPNEGVEASGTAHGLYLKPVAVESQRKRGQQSQSQEQPELGAQDVPKNNRPGSFRLWRWTSRPSHAEVSWEIAYRTCVFQSYLEEHQQMLTALRSFASCVTEQERGQSKVG